MKNAKWFAGLILTVGLSVPAMARDWNDNRHDDRQDFRAVERLRDRVRHDEMRLREDRREGRVREIRRDMAQLERDQRALDAMQYRGNRYDDRSWR